MSKPDVSSQSLRDPVEFTITALVLSFVLAVVLAGANAYLALFAGMTVSASIPASVMSMAFFRLLRRNNVLENNLVQTAASSGEAVAAGVCFTLPALILLDCWTSFSYWQVALIGMVGGSLGVLFTIPLRRALIIEQKLQFPEGIATAEVLRSAERGGVRYLVGPALAAALFKLGAEGLRLWTDPFAVARRAGNSIISFGANLSPALVAVGYIVGLNIAVLMFLGGFCNWYIAIPWYAATHPWPAVNGVDMPALDFAKQIWGDKTRYIGVGGMLLGGLWTIVKLRGSLLKGITAGLGAYKGGQENENKIPRTEKDIPMKWVLLMIAFSVIPVFVLYQMFVGRLYVSLPMTIVMIVAGFLFSAVAGYMAGILGSSNCPISGLTIATVLVSALLILLLMGKAEARQGAMAAILIGSVVCCAASMASDNLQDLKAGHILGATPWKQQLMQFVGVGAGALVLAPILGVLYRAHGFAGHSSAVGKSGPFDAPQANLMAGVAKGIFEGGIPWGYVGIGIGFAAAVIALDTWLERRRSKFRAPVLAVAIGFYLPFRLSVPILIGGCLHTLVAHLRRRRAFTKEQTEDSDQRGILFASGLITGEALMGILLACAIVLSGKMDLLAILSSEKKPLPVLSETLGSWPAMLLLAGVVLWLYKTAAAKSKAERV